MSDAKVKIPLERYTVTHSMTCAETYCTALDVAVLESAYAQACIDRDNAITDKRRILDNFCTCEMKYRRQDAALEIAMAEIVRLGGGKA